MQQTEPLLISVVLCTYNRCELMASALRSVCQQTIKPANYEVIVVDNNSTDGTRQHVLEVSQRYTHVRYCFEAKQGLSHGRNAGLHAARGRYVAYIDDDCTVPTEWLGIAQEVIEQVAPAIFGGPYRPFYNTTKPPWYRDSYGSYEGGSSVRWLAGDEYLSGTNMFIRRTVLEELRGFSPEVGMTGNRLGYGEETIIQQRFRRERPGEGIYYEPRLGVSHLVRSEKMKLLWCARQMFISGRDWQRVLYETNHRPGNILRSFLRAGRALYHLAKGLVQGVVGRDRSRYPCVENYLYEVVFVQLQIMGAVYEQFTHRPS